MTKQEKQTILVREREIAKEYYRLNELDGLLTVEEKNKKHELVREYGCILDKLGFSYKDPESVLLGIIFQFEDKIL